MADQNDPLAVLEDILKDAQKKRGGGSGGAGGATAGLASDKNKAAAADPSQAGAQQAAEEEAKLQAEAAAAEETRLEAERQQAIAVQKQLIEKEVKTSPQYQAAQDQAKEKAEEIEEKQEAGDGFEIRQLDHSKISTDQSST